MSVRSIARRENDTMIGTRIGRTALLCLAALAATAALAAPAQAAFGDNFGPADALGPAWPAGITDSWWAGTCDLEGASTSNGGVGTPPSTLAHCIDPGAPYVFSPAGDPNPSPPRETTWMPGQEPSWRLDPVTEAGAHPDASGTFWLQRSPEIPEGGAAFFAVEGDGDTKTIVAKLPPGLVGNPNAVPQCASENLGTVPPTCPPETQIGVSTLTLGAFGDFVASQFIYPVYNVEPRDGKTAEFLVSGTAETEDKGNIPIVAKARTDGDFGIDAVALDIPGGLPLLGQTLTFWGVPWAAEHDKFRAPTGLQRMPLTGLPDGFGATPQPYKPTWGKIRAFFSNPTECAPAPPVTTLELTSWQKPNEPVSTDAPADSVVTDCDEVDFDPSIDMTPTSTVADSPSGLEVDLTLPQKIDAPIEPPEEFASQPEIDDYVDEATTYWKSPESRATSQLDKAVVTLPEGVSPNLSSAQGLEGCSDQQIGLTQQGPPAVFNNEDPFDDAGAECPNGSKIGTVAVYTPLLPLGEGEVPGTPNLTGEVVLGSPKSTDPESGQMFRLFLVVRNEKRGLLAKIAGSAVVDKDTGQIVTTFDKNPRVPFETMHLELKKGPRGILALPQRCQTSPWLTAFTPWTAAHGGGGLPVSDGGSFLTNSRCAFGFAPTLRAGVDNRQGGASGTFSLEIVRSDGQQWVRGVTVELPEGLLGSVKDVPLCSNAQANANTCPAASLIGTVDAAGGVGDPFFLEKKGSVYLTESYKGAPWGLAVSVPAEGGPFKGQFALKTIVVRQALKIDPNDGSVTTVSDPIPLVHHGIPLRARQATVKIDRPGFIKNPTDCSVKQIAAKVTSAQGAVANLGSRFQGTGCANLRFAPKLGMRLTGKRQTKTGGHPGVRAVVTQTPGQAAVDRADVRLPLSLALDPENAQALCDFADGTKDDLENHCPKGSIVGRARAESPLLKRPLSGDVYFVKNVRRDPNTGNLIRTLPMIVVALRGELAINLRGVSSTTKKGKLVSTFASVPDAPIKQFNLNIAGGRNGILVVTRKRNGDRQTICGKQVAEADFDGQNGRRYDRDIKIKTPCKKAKKSKRAKRRG